ncbi:MAG TPA: hypothetical protein VFS39_10415 [Nitrospira sp.]|nr:hypothetical protein [Nitrospira sp.]
MRPFTTMIIAAFISVANAGAVMAATADAGARSAVPDTMSQEREPAADGTERAISEATKNLLPGDRLVLGRITEFRGGQYEVDIGNPQMLYIPAKPAQMKGQTFKPGDPIVVTLNDHNAVVDYHHPNEPSHHHVMRGRLVTPLTVGLDKAVIHTDKGATESLLVAERAKGKLTAMPVGPDIWFLTDETGLLVDAQLAGPAAVRESAENNKARIKGAHRQVRAVFREAKEPSVSGPEGVGRLTIVEQGKERQVPYRPPLEKLDRLHAGQEVVLLMDDEGYVLEIAAPDLGSRK